jgi:formate hydrogenlyase transcriptional activator
LATHFALRAASRFGVAPRLPGPDDLDLLVRYAWPGNVRELENLIERAVLLSPGKELRIPLSELKNGTPIAAEDNSFTSSTSLAAPISTLEEAERQHILRALKQTEWRIAGPKGASTLLGMKRTTLQARMRKLGIRRPI